MARLGDYVRILNDSLTKTNRAEDRTAYLRHLASAALFFESAQRAEWGQLKERLDHERADFGRGFLAGEPGEVAERAFNDLFTLLSKALPKS